MCQQAKRPFANKPVPTLRLPVARPLTRWIADYHGPFIASYPAGHSTSDCSHPNRYVLAIVDSTSMWVELVPTEDCSAETTFKAMFDRVISRIGLPAGICLQTDLGACFTSKLGALFAKTFGIQQYFSTAHHHQSNVRAENIAVVLHQTLKTLCAQQSDWSNLLSSVEMAYRSTATTNTALSPFEVVFGRPMPLPVDVSLCAACPEVTSEESYANDIRLKLQIYEQVAMQNCKDSAFRHSQKTNVQAQEPLFKAGDKVLLFDPTSRKNESAKLKLRLTGPFLIIAVLPNYNFKLKHVATAKELRRPVHASEIFS